MSLFAAPLFSLLILNQALNIFLCESVLNISEVQSQQFVLPTVGNTPQVHSKVNKETQDKQRIIKTESSYTSNRSKRESSEIDNDLDLSKRLRDFVGKRSQHEMYSLTPEAHMLTPLDISRIRQYPLETSIGPEDRLLFDFNTDEVDKNDGDLQEKIWIPHEEKRLRDFVGKRSADVEKVQWDPYEKRLRDFVGKRDNTDFIAEKRLRDFVGKRVHDYVQKSFAFHGDGIENEKRLREFVGKRNDLDDITFYEKLADFSDNINNIDKRPREFLGKRDGIQENFDINNRLMDLVRNDSPYFTWIPSQKLEKRLRDFVGKRDGSETFSKDKRLREFVGKRDVDLHNEDKRIREFIGKRDFKRPRQFLGKRSLLSEDEDDRIELDKKLRDFVGKRSADGEYEEIKRLREFVGKRSELLKDPEELLSAVKRLRDFVGKRNYFPDVHSDTIVKRIREFIGRR